MVLSTVSRFHQENKSMLPTFYRKKMILHNEEIHQSHSILSGTDVSLLLILIFLFLITIFHATE